MTVINRFFYAYGAYTVKIRVEGAVIARRIFFRAMCIGLSARYYKNLHDFVVRSDKITSPPDSLAQIQPILYRYLKYI